MVGKWYHVDVAKYGRPSEVELNCLPINQTTRNTPLSPQGKDNLVMSSLSCQACRWRDDILMSRMPWPMLIVSGPGPNFRLYSSHSRGLVSVILLIISPPDVLSLSTASPSTSRCHLTLLGSQIILSLIKLCNVITLIWIALLAFRHRSPRVLEKYNLGSQLAEKSLTRPW